MLSPGADKASRQGSTIVSKKKSKSTFSKFFWHYYQEAKLFISVSERNQKFEEMLGKQVSQVSLYNMANEVREHSLEL